MDADEPVLKEDEHDQNRQGDENRRGEEVSESESAGHRVRVSADDGLHHRHETGGQGEHILGPGENDREEHVIPGQHEREQRDRHDPRRGERQDDPNQGGQPIAAIDQRGIFQLRRKAGEIRPQQPGAKGNRERGVGDDQAGVGVLQAKVAQHDEERDDQADRGDDVGEEEETRHDLADPAANARERVAGEGARGHGDDHRRHREDRAVREPAHELGVGDHRGVILERWLDQAKLRLGDHQELLGLERRPHHPVRWKDVDDEDDVGKDHAPLDAEAAMARSIRWGSGRGSHLRPPPPASAPSTRNRRTRPAPRASSPRGRRPALPGRPRRPDCTPGWREPSSSSPARPE